MLFGQQGRERQRFQLFNSSTFEVNDLLFKDETFKLAILPDDMDVSQVLGLDYVALLKGLGHEGAYSYRYVVHFYFQNRQVVGFVRSLTVCVCVQEALWRTVLCDGAASATQSRRNVSSGLSV